MGSRRHLSAKWLAWRALSPGASEPNLPIDHRALPGRALRRIIALAPEASEQPLKEQASLAVGVVLERRKLDNPWQDHDWRPVAVIPGAGAKDPAGDWTLLRSDENTAQYHAGTLPLNLFPKETEGYKLNLSQSPPRLFIVLRATEDPDCEHECLPFLVTACPYEAQDYLDSSEELVEVVAMPDAVLAFVQHFVDRHHVDEVFQKRKRKRWSEGASIGLRASSVGADDGNENHGR